jgi:hypothetical protein
MRGTLTGTLAVALAAAVVLGTSPASALPAAAGLGETKVQTGLVHDVAKKRYYSRKWKDRPYYRYGYRPYRYRPYAYYDYYDYPYYYRRPGISLWFGF